MAKITKATKGGRTIYKIAGTSKYAFTMAKAKEIAAKAGGAKRTTAGKRVSRGHGGVEEGYFDTKGRRAVRRKKPDAAAERRFADNDARDFLQALPPAPAPERRYDGGIAATKREIAAFKKDPYKMVRKAGFSEDVVTPAFIRAVLARMQDALEEAEHQWGESARQHRKAQRAGRKTAKPSTRSAGRKPAVKKAKEIASRRKAKTGAGVKIIGRAYTNRYGERVGPTRILGRTVDYAMKIVRTKGRDLKATPEHRKEIVSKYRKALQKAGFLR